MRRLLKNKMMKMALYVVAGAVFSGAILGMLTKIPGMEGLLSKIPGSDIAPVPPVSPDDDVNG